MSVAVAEDATLEATLPRNTSSALCIYQQCESRANYPHLGACVYSKYVWEFVRSFVRSRILLSDASVI